MRVDTSQTYAMNKKGSKQQVFHNLVHVLPEKVCTLRPWNNVSQQAQPPIVNKTWGNKCVHVHVTSTSVLLWKFSKGKI